MKTKILISLFVVSLFGIVLVNAQCTPDPAYTNTGLYPADSLPHADVGTSYSTIMTIVIPADTILPIVGAVPIDSVGITSIDGLSANLTYQADATNDYWPGGTSGCILISGTPAPADAGIDTLTFNIQTCLQGQQIPGTEVRILRIQGTSGIEIIIPDKFNVLQNLPNPFSNKTKIVYTTPVNDNFDFTVYNIIGDVVSQKSLKAKAGTNNIIFDADGLTSGIYLYKISNENQVITKRMIISK